MLQLEAETLTALRAQRPRAVLFATSRHWSADWSAFANVNQLADIGPEPSGLRSVVVPNYDGAADLACALKGIGYSDFAIVAGPAELSTVRDRVTGFQSELPGVPVYHNAFSRDGGYSATAKLLANGRLPDCIFAVTDVMAIGAIAAIRDAGLTPGADVAVAGFDGIPLLRDVSPQLTTVALPLDWIGASALELPWLKLAIRHPPAQCSTRFSCASRPQVGIAEQIGEAASSPVIAAQVARTWSRELTNLTS
ncbi:LacI family DNA-binding transcriptional regulator [Leifsonia shinshuensis]|uniref:LacI family DNA-binding transcriptional regulator n=1 Tax=Leifsonia shinshuensis TaxID=150026 RepID=UPI002155FB55|nr:substrate-binding domain-containing protein [Leifsonia shinshuensis]